MKKWTKLGKKILKISQLLENPVLLSKRIKGEKIDVDLYLKLKTDWFKCLVKYLSVIFIFSFLYKGLITT